MTGLDIVTDAARELGILGAADTLDGNLSAQGLNKLNRIFDNWSAQLEAAYAVAFSTFTLTPNLNPHTIGPTGATFTVTQRPVTIEAASIVLTNVTPSVRVPLTLRDAQWYQSVSVPAEDTDLPTDLYYDPTWGNGSLYLYPVPTTAYDIELQIRVLLGQLLLTSTFSLPPGYQDAATLTLAEDWAGPLPVQPPPMLPTKATQARARIFNVNTVVPKLTTRDAGMPQSGRTLPYFNWKSGGPR